MKKSLIILALLPLLFFGCKKGGSTDEPKPEETFKVSINVTGFSQDITPMNKRSSSTKSASNASEPLPITTLELFVYTQQGNLVVKKTNFLKDNNYNTIPGSEKFDLVLPKGNYKIGLLGHNRQYGGIVYTFDEREMNGHSLRVDGAGFDFNKISVKDAYVHRYSDVKLYSDTTFAPFQMHRYTSKLNVKIEDKIPNEVSSIRVGGSLVSTVYPFTNEKNPSYKESYFVFSTTNNVGKENVVLSTPIYPDANQPSRPMKIWISAYTADNTLLKSIQIDNLILKSNHVTTLSGKLFEGYNSNANSGLNPEFVMDFVKDEINVPF